MGQYLLISDAAKEVKVESHVLRYWEEELHLPIKRNELGHRYYTEEDVERFKQIKSMKERGLQLKAIKMILKDGKLNIVGEGVPEPARAVSSVEERHTAGEIQTVGEGRERQELIPENKEEKSRRLQWLLQQLIREALQENNDELSRTIRESVLKELDYQFRLQEERDEERDRLQQKRSEEYYQRMDELLRQKSRKEVRHAIRNAAAADKVPKKQEGKQAEKEQKAKRKGHFIF